jgi:hypothetical protein
MGEYIMSAEVREARARFNRIRWIASFAICVAFSIVGGVIGFVFLPVALAFASVVSGPLTFRYLIEGSGWGLSGAKTSADEGRAWRISWLIASLAITIGGVALVGWLLGAWQALVASIAVYAVEFLLAREFAGRSGRLSAPKGGADPPDRS